MALIARASELAETSVEVKGLSDGWMKMKEVFGRDLSLIVARRGPDYHSRPHAHPVEQLVYVVDGDITFFVSDGIYELGPGDFLRVPSMAVHWLWNRTDSESLLVEAYSPGLEVVDTSRTADLLMANETPGQIRRETYIWASDDYLEVEKKLG